MGDRPPDEHGEEGTSSRKSLMTNKDMVEDISEFEQTVARRIVYLEHFDKPNASDGVLADKVDRNVKANEAEGQHGSVACASVKGWQASMEHFSICEAEEDVSFVGVFDGFDGSQCAKFMESLPKQISDQLVADPNIDRQAHPLAMLKLHKDEYASADNDYLLEVESDSVIGCTGATVVSAGGVVLVSWVGDCAAFLVRSGKIVPLTSDHIPSNPGEQQRIHKAGGQVHSDYVKLKRCPEALAVSRAFGARRFKPDDDSERCEDSEREGVVTSVPDVTQLVPGAGDLFVVIVSASLLAVRTVANIVEELEGRQGTGESLMDIVQSIVSESVADTRGSLVGVENASLAALRIPPSKGSSDKLYTSSTELYARWKRLFEHETAIFAQRFCHTLAVGEDRRSRIGSIDPSIAGDLEQHPASGSTTGEETASSGAGAPLIAGALQVHLFAAHVPVLLGWGCADLARNQPIGGAIMIAAAIGYAGLAAGLQAGRLPPVASEVFVFLLTLLVVAGYDAATRCTTDVWGLALLGALVVSVSTQRRVSVTVTWLLCLLWLLLRTIDESHSFGLCDTTLHRDFDPFLSALFSRLTALLIGGGLAAVFIGSLRAHRAEFERAISAVVAASHLSPSVYLTQPTEATAVLDACTDADPTERLSEAVKKLLATGGPTRNPSCAELGPGMDAPSHHPGSHLDMGSSLPGSGPEEELQSMLGEDICGGLAGSPTNRMTGYVKRQATILTIALQKDMKADHFRHFLRLVQQAVETSEGHLIRCEGSIAVVGWNTADPLMSHAQHAWTFVQSVESNFPSQLPYNIAIVVGNVHVTDPGLALPKIGVHVGGRPVQQSYILSRFARSIKARVVLTDKVYEANRSMMDARPVDSILFVDEAPSKSPTAISSPQNLYELLGARSNGTKAGNSQYLTAFSHLQKLKFEEARDAFKLLVEQDEARNGGKKRDHQIRRLHNLAAWLLNTDGSYLCTSKTYHRRLGCELEDVVSVDDEEEDDATVISRINRPGRNSRPPQPELNPLQGSRNGRRQTEVETRALINAIKVKEAEANMEFLKAWDCAGGSNDSSKKVTKEGGIPLRFEDHKNRLWCRGARRLGSGAFGEVWLGLGTDGCLVAMKSMKLPALRNEDITTNPAANTAGSVKARRLKRLAAQQGGGGGGGGGDGGQQNRFEQIDELIKEVGLMNKFRHENIVSYMASAVVDGYVMIVMEYLSGGSLHDLITNFGTSELPTTSVQRYTQDIIRGLEFLHGHDIIHRDMKPHNVLLLVDGRCKLADFGASAGLSELAKKTANMIGTPLYMAPEACTSAGACKASDVWAVGIIVCELFTGSVPYPSKDHEAFNPHTFMYQLGNIENFMPIVPRNIPQLAIKFAEQCLQRDAEARPTATELKSDAFVID